MRGGRKQDGTGYRYIDNNKKFIKSDWFKDEDGSWYYFDDRGYMKTSLVKDNGKWYYLYDKGYLRTNMWIGNYYLGGDSLMFVNTATSDGYRFGSEGAYTDGQKNILLPIFININY